MCIVPVLCTRMIWKGSLVVVFVLLLVLWLYNMSFRRPRCFDKQPFIYRPMTILSWHVCVLIYYTNFALLLLSTLLIYYIHVYKHSFQEMYPSSLDYVSLMVSSPVSLVGHVPCLVHLDVARRSFRRVCPSLVTGEFVVGFFLHFFGSSGKW